MTKINSPTRTSPRKQPVIALRSRKVHRSKPASRTLVFVAEPSETARKSTPIRMVNEETGTRKYVKVLAKSGVPRYSYFQYLMRSMTMSHLRDHKQINKFNPAPLTALAC